MNSTRHVSHNFIFPYLEINMKCYKKITYAVKMKVSLPIKYVSFRGKFVKL